MPVTDFEHLFAKGLAALDDGECPAALVYFEKASRLERTPAVCSYLAYCIARERGQFKAALALCAEALEKEPDNPVHYLNLGRVHLLRGQKSEAIRIFRQGLGYGAEPRICAELDRLGTRKPPVLPFLRRENPVNKCLGIICRRMGLR